MIIKKLKQISLNLGIDKNTLNQQIKALKSGKRQVKQENTPIVTISSNKLTICQKNLLSLYFISGDNLPFTWLNDKLKNVQFSEANLIAIFERILELTKETKKQRLKAQKKYEKK